MKKRIISWLVAALSVITLVSAAPLISVLVAGVIATLLNCKVDEGNVHPCMLLGIDIGGLLYFLGVFGWFMLATLPVLACALSAWIVIAVIKIGQRFRGGGG